LVQIYESTWNNPHKILVYWKNTFLNTAWNCSCCQLDAWKAAWVIHEGTSYSSQSNKYQSSLYTTLFVINHKQYVSAIKAIFRLNTKSYRQYILQCHEFYGCDLMLHQMEVLQDVVQIKNRIWRICKICTLKL
jgi:hypothetical protein